MHQRPLLQQKRKNQRFVCLAYEKEKVRAVNEEEWTLQKALSLYHLQTRKTHDAIGGITFLGELMQTKRMTYIDYDPVTKLIAKTHYTDPTDYERSESEGLSLSSEAIKAKLEELKAIQQTEAKLISQLKSQLPD